MVKHGEIAGRTTATTTVYASKLAKALVIDIGTFTKRFVLLAGLAPVSRPTEAHYAVNSAGLAPVSLWLTSMYQSSTIPNVSAGPRQGLLLHAAAEVTLQRGEWNAVFFGIQFRSAQLLAGAVEALLPDIEIKDGLSLSGDTAFLNNDREFSLVLLNAGETMTLNTTDPIIKLTVDASDVPVYLNVFWTCPKCKHGGNKREHSHVSGKCRYAAKGTEGIPPPRIAEPTVD